MADSDVEFAVALEDDEGHEAEENLESVSRWNGRGKWSSTSEDDGEDVHLDSCSRMALVGVEM